MNKQTKINKQTNITKQQKQINANKYNQKTENK